MAASDSSESRSPRDFFSTTNMRIKSSASEGLVTRFSLYFLIKSICKDT
jgi:hypothetical protein